MKLFAYAFALTFAIVGGLVGAAIIILSLDQNGHGILAVLAFAVTVATIIAGVVWAANE